MSRIDYSKVFNSQNYHNKNIPSYKWTQTDLTSRMINTFNRYYGKSTILANYPIQNNEVLVIEVMVKVITRHQSEFADIIHRGIPYPVLLIQNYRDKYYKLSMVSAHENAIYSSRKVIEERSTSKWVTAKVCISLLQRILECFTTQKSSNEVFRDADTIIYCFNREHDQAAQKPEFDDLINLYGRSQNTMLERLWIIKEMFECVRDVLSENGQEPQYDEDDDYQHYIHLQCFLEQFEEVKDEIDYDLSKIECTEIEDEIECELPIPFSEDNEEQINYVIHKAVLLIVEEFEAYCVDLEENRLLVSYEEQMAIDLLEELINEMNAY